uniref:KxDL domain-containing protein n=1 Tax=Lactuca sativa TaxID=4236 RepID=A0A9R1WWA9_LACSA|nr:hypothetical protein LSAT_V11C800389560 [Lactuca sativa]
MKIDINGALWSYCEPLEGLPTEHGGSKLSSLLINKRENVDKLHLHMHLSKFKSIFFLHNCKLGCLEDTNAVLSHFNDYSDHFYAEVSSNLYKNTHLLKSMNLELDYIFQKLRSLTAKIKATYPGDLTIEPLDRRSDNNSLNPRQTQYSPNMSCQTGLKGSSRKHCT